jgi:3-oxoacyl-[acyl-carrier-protein] synthase II
MIAGGTEAPLTPLSFAGFCNLMAMNTQHNDAPQTASKPFDLNRGGFVMSEGSGILVLETLRHALARQAPTIYCELAGYGASSDAYHITSPDPEGDGLVRAMHRCLQDAQLTSQDVQYINAHGTSTKKNDLFETIAFKKFFGLDHASKLAISSIKGSTGHSLGAAGGLEAVATVKALQQKEIPPTVNLQTPDPECDLDYTANQSKSMPTLQVAISDNLGFGGHNGVVAFRTL